MTDSAQDGVASTAPRHRTAAASPQAGAEGWDGRGRRASVVAVLDRRRSHGNRALESVEWLMASLRCRHVAPQREGQRPASLGKVRLAGKTRNPSGLPAGQKTYGRSRFACMIQLRFPFQLVPAPRTSRLPAADFSGLDAVIVPSSLRAASAAALLGAAALTVAWNRTPLAPLPVDAVLAVSLRDRRPIEPRLSLQGGYAAWGGGDRLDELALAKAARGSRARIAARSTAPGGETLTPAHSLVRLLLAKDEAALNRAVSELERTAEGTPRGRKSTLRLRRRAPRSRAGQTLDRVAALAATRRAAELAQPDPIVLFNRGLALPAMGLRRIASAAWQRYLAVETDPGWLAEARERRAALDVPSRRDEFAKLATLWGGGPADTDTVPRQISGFAQEARERALATAMGRGGAAQRLTTGGLGSQARKKRSKARTPDPMDS